MPVIVVFFSAEHMTLLQLQVEMRENLERMERLLTSILRAVRPSQKIIIPKDLPTLPLKELEEFEKNEEYLSDKANRADTVCIFSSLW